MVKKGSILAKNGQKSSFFDKNRQKTLKIAIF